MQLQTKPVMRWKEQAASTERRLSFGCASFEPRPTSNRTSVSFQNFLSVHNVPLFRPFWKICTGLRGVFTRPGPFFHIFISQSRLKCLRYTLAATCIEHFRQGSTNEVLKWQEILSLFVKFFQLYSPCRVQNFEKSPKSSTLFIRKYFARDRSKNAGHPTLSLSFNLHFMCRRSSTAFFSF